MSDDRLIQALRGLDRPVDADPGFTETLFEDLRAIDSARHARRPSSMLLVAAALITSLIVGAAMAVGGGVIDLPWEASRDPFVSEPDATAPASAAQDWPGPLRREPDHGLAVIPFTNQRAWQPGDHLFFDDAPGDLGAMSAEFVDLSRLHLQLDVGEPGYFAVNLSLSGAYPADQRGLAGRRTAYGLVLETNGDGVPDYRLGVENVPGGRYRLWLTDLATGETRAGVFGDGLGSDRLGDGYPFGDARHPGEGTDEHDDWRRSAWILVGPDHIGLDRHKFTDGQIHFYAWASLVDNGSVLVTDHAPDAGWLRAGPIVDS